MEVAILQEYVRRWLVRLGYPVSHQGVDDSN